MSAILKANDRSELQKSSLNKLRASGQIPAVVYGSNMESKPVYVESTEFVKTIREVGRNGIISLDVDGKQTDVMLTDYQQDSIKGHFLHADFFAVDMKAEREATVRLALVGEAAGVKDGGVMQQAVHEVSVTATPANIPQAIELDISDLQVNENLTVADLKNKGGSYTINDDESLVLVTILPPKQEEEINSGEQQEAGTPDNEEGRETEPSEG
ncbi:50S ribosomal protein L25/general stress protein Ctc [Mesobacillus maritimus]|uniref:50S ribosomal protein L25/general stress protein Ctc n=1 Tax=Mesobacillus maritimus TaxID=1643336 RepID=UPI00203AC0FE|nr:50S ribosomal protein L25/general stress protein Ctc [Mesobacillus maritimus]MCM3588567.1 50S ribosomal protein L25/general stress protein Ctc [Mesobacillus maritimus]MCM3671584.1 50S ribosomal protein L25/general stress protein Ctc [Mesobacillus maritimus]